ncbi:MAG: rhomboid family intramembrane serine protease [Calditrichaeota bacterium]|nr:rhomboid family intramembrane serine protease [Calditrichota bacterium]
MSLYNYQRTYSGGIGGGLTPAVKGLLIANAAVFVLQWLFPNTLVYIFGLAPHSMWAQRALWQPLTYMFLHGGIMHLLFNMLVLWMFGTALESLWGTVFFLRYYFITGIGAGLSNAILTPNSAAIIIGASGAMYGLLAAYGILFPNNIIYFYFLLPIKAKYLVAIFGGFEFLASLRPGASPIAHLVHLGGMVVGVLYLTRGRLFRWTKHSLRDYQSRRQREQHRRRSENAERLRREVDDLLDKINEVGMENLTSWERRRLQELSLMLKQMEDKERDFYI